MGEERLEPWAQANAYTSQTSREIGGLTANLPEDLQISPARLDHLLQGYFNSWGRYGLQISDSLFLGGIKPDQRLDQYPVIRRFYVAGPARNTRYVTDFYDLANEVTNKRATGKEMLEQGNVERARQIELSFENQIYESVTAVRENLAFVRAMNEIVVTTEDIQAVREVMTYLDAHHYPGIVEMAQAQGAWNDIGYLKRLVQDELYRLRNEVARNFMTVDLPKFREQYETA
jgi:hypothetical protein